MMTLSEELLASMAMRCRHDFGLLDPKEKTIQLEEMHKLYRLYSLDLGNEAIAEETGFSIGTIKQIHEEVEGVGFFSEENKNFYKKIL